MLFQPHQPSGFAIIAILYPFFTITPLLIFLALFLVHFKKIRQKMFFHISMLFAATIINQACLMFMVVTSQEAAAKALFIAAQVLEVAGMLVMVIVLEAFEENKLFSPRVAGFTAIAAAIVGAMISGPDLVATPIDLPITSGYIIGFGRRDMAGFLMGIFPLLVVIWLVRSFITKRKLTRSQHQRHLLSWLYVGIFLAQVTGSLAPVLVDSMNPGGMLRELSANIGIGRVVGIVMIGVAFSRVAKTPWLLQLQRVHLLLVYATNGITLYSKRFREDITDTDVQLLAGAISAVASLFKESTKETSPIEAIQFKGKSVRVIDRGTFTCAIMVDFASQASDDAHERFVRDFETAFAAEIAGFAGEISKFEQADAVAAKYFA